MVASNLHSHSRPSPNGQARRNGRHGRGGESRRIRYAVAGLGYISQAAMLPAFQHARKNSELAALVSDDPEKLQTLGKRHGISALYSYDRFEECLESGRIDAVYIALPNSMHREFCERAAACRVHILCEKPLAVTERECEAVIDACERAGVQLMTAYRLHFDPTTLKVLQIVRSGKIGELRLFSSVFTMQVRDQDNIRLRSAMGGGPLHDIGIYCINAARMIFGHDPVQVAAWADHSDDPRFREVPQSVSAMLRYGPEQLAQFVCSFGAADISHYRVVGARGDICVEPAYDFVEPLEYSVTINGKSRTRHAAKRDQFAPELVYFSDCILQGRQPEPSAQAGLADVRTIRALQYSIRTGEPVSLGPPPRPRMLPSQRQEISRPPVRKPQYVHAQSPSGD